MINSDYQAKYIAHELERVYANDDVAKLSGLMFDAQIIPTPHQIDAALFALNSPMARGIILADEVGLGKTIEAGIVIMQYYSERKRKILIIAPSSLRQQWAQELQEKFNLPATVVDSKWMKAKRTIEKDGIYICSYEFANRHSTRLSNGWNLLVLDEAHKLRNFYNNQKGIASAVSDIAKGSEKSLLLTATPLQNRLEELYGLVSVVDPKYFYKLDVFRQRYIKSNHPFALDDLRSRMSKIAKRTLRSEVKKYIKYTDRIAKTVQFEPSGDEQKLYELVDEYLHRDKLYAFASSQRHLSALILRKRLGSSTFAVASTLRNIVRRMKEEYAAGKVRDNRGGLIDELGDLNDEEIEAFEETGAYDDYIIKSAKERVEFQAEIDELKSYVDFADSIKENVKAEKLVEAINVGFNALESKAARKAIIFTESTLTQNYIAKTLKKQGYDGKIVLFNGQNNSPESTEIYRQWLADNENSDVVTGIESADRRKALIDKFKEPEMQIMIATEAASEGINLQFCSMLINYDLPWNPQRVEQRIGRVHRMGQKYDVVVVNFSNQGNVAEQRILELLTDKFSLFKSTFGASNDVLGVIESGLDFEKKISDILNTCRTDDEINQRFEKLQEEFKSEIDSEQQAARTRIFEGLDPHVQDRFRRYDEQAEEAFTRFERLFMNLTRYILRGNASFANEHVFDLKTAPEKDIECGTYFYKTERLPHARQYKYADDLAEYVRHTAKTTQTPPAELTFDMSQSDRVASEVKNLVGARGIMIVEQVTFPMKIDSSDMGESYILASAQTDGGVLLDTETCRKILDLCVVDVEYKEVVPGEVLQNHLTQQIAERQEEVKGRNTEVYLDKKDLLERQYKDKIVEYEMKADKLNAKIQDLQKQERQAGDAASRLKIASEVQILRKKVRTLNREKYDLEDSMDEQISDKIALAQQASEGGVERMELFVVEFILK